MVASPQRCSLSIEALRELIWAKCKGHTWKIAAAFDHGQSGRVGLRELEAGLKKLQIAVHPTEVAELFSQVCQQHRTATVPLAELTRLPKCRGPSTATVRSVSPAPDRQPQASAVGRRTASSERQPQASPDRRLHASDVAQAPAMRSTASSERLKGTRPLQNASPLRSGTPQKALTKRSGSPGTNNGASPVRSQRSGSPNANSRASPLRVVSFRTQACRSASPNVARERLCNDASKTPSQSAQLKQQLENLRVRQHRNAARAASEQANLRLLQRAEIEEINLKQRNLVEGMDDCIKLVQEEEQLVRKERKTAKQELKSVEHAQEQAEAELSEHRFEAEALLASALEAKRVTNRVRDRQVSVDRLTKELELQVDGALGKLWQLSNEVDAAQSYASMCISDGAHATRVRDDEEELLCQERLRIRTEIEAERQWRNRTIQRIEASVHEIELELDRKFEREAQACAKQRQINSALEKRAGLAESQVSQRCRQLVCLEQELDSEQSECEAFVESVRSRAAHIVAMQERRQNNLRSEADMAMERGRSNMRLLREDLEETNRRLQSAREQKSLLEQAALRASDERCELESELAQKNTERQRHANRCCRLYKELASVRSKISQATSVTTEDVPPGISALADREIEERITMVQEELCVGEQQLAQSTYLQLHILREGCASELETTLEALTQELNAELLAVEDSFCENDSSMATGSTHGDSLSFSLSAESESDKEPADSLLSSNFSTLVQSELRARVKDLQVELRNQTQEQHWAHVSEVALGNDLKELGAQVRTREKEVDRARAKLRVD